MLSGVYTSSLDWVFMAPYIFISVGLVVFQFKYKANLGLVGLGWFLIIIANVGYTTGNVSFFAAPVISLLGKCVIFYWMTRPRFSMITEDFQQFLTRSSHVSSYVSLVSFIETSTKANDIRWIKNKVVEGGASGVRSILILTIEQVSDELTRSGLLDLSELYVVRMTQNHHPIVSAFS